MEEAKLIYTFRKNATDEIRVRTVKYSNSEMVDIRVFVEKPTGEKIPTSKGISFSASKLPDFARGIRLLKEHFKVDEDINYLGT